jgi:hypothetical protein
MRSILSYRVNKSYKKFVELTKISEKNSRQIISAGNLMDITKIICHLRHMPHRKLPASLPACPMRRMLPASLPAYPSLRMLFHMLLPEPALSSVSIRINLKVP